MTPSLGLWITTANTAVMEIAAESGIGTLVLDLEHGIFDASMTEGAVGLGRALGLTVLVKVLAPTGPAVMAALDRGASGIIVPQLRDGDHAAAVTAFAKYPPMGLRGASGGRVFGYRPANADFFRNEDRLRPCYAMIETAGALADVAAIAALDTVDGLFVGPTDLALSRGRGCYRRDHRDHDDIIRVAEAASRAGKPWIFPAWTEAEQQWARDLGASTVVMADEFGAFKRGLQDCLSDARRTLEIDKET